MPKRKAAAVALPTFVAGQPVTDVDSGEPSKSWVYTWFFEEEQTAAEWLKELDTKRHVAAVETCPETKREHIQGEVTFPRAYRFSQLKKLNDKWHVAPAKCVSDSNYCRKFGNRMLIDKDDRKQGHRSDLASVRDTLKENPSMRSLCQTAENWAQLRAAETFLKYAEPPRPVAPIEVVWYYGDTGTGKTRAVYAECPNVFRPLSYKWWEGYDGHTEVLIDDFRKDWCKFHELLSPLLDIYPFRVETKGGSRQARYTRIFITSCHPPWSVYETREDVQQLLRRITSCVQFCADGSITDREDLLRK